MVEFQKDFTCADNKERKISMTVSGVSSTNNVDQNDYQNAFSQRKQYVNDLSQSLKSGDLAGAQKAFASLQQITPNSSQNSTANTGATGSSSIGSDFSALGKALQSGDLTGAQKAFGQVQQDMKTAGAAHHHHHHHSKASNSSATTQDSSGTTSSSATSGNSINIIA